MSKPNSTSLKLVCLLVAIIVAISISTNWLSASAISAHQDLPEGQGVELARDKCTTCHEADIIMGQRLSKQGWTREVEKMVRWGAVVSDAEKAILVDYFSERFKPGKAAPSIATNNLERGKQIFENKCTVCHESDLTEGQRLTRQGWTREVEKMVRWGATVTEAEKEPLVDYLAHNYPLRPLPMKK
ncbi:MAG: c-type cytochrome [Blastocatellales bacterium]